MIYLSQLLGNPVLDSEGEKIGTVSDLGIATGEVFPRVTSLAFMGPGRTPFMISWRKYVDTFDEDEVHLKVPSTDIRFSYLQPDEVLLARDILNKQIVDTRGMRVVRVNDLKLSDTSSSQLRLLGAEVGARGLLRSLSPRLEKLALKIAHAFGKSIPEKIIAWNYMDLVERDLSDVKLSVSHKTLDDMHPADIADIIERLDPRLRGQVFAQLDDEQRAEAMAELDDDAMAAELMGSMDDASASRILSEMDPDDAAELVSELDYDKAEKLLRLMGVGEQKAIRQLLGYREDTAGRIMTSEFVSVPEDGTVSDAVEAIRALDEDFESVHYVYLVDNEERLSGVVSMRALVAGKDNDRLRDLAQTEDLITASPEDDQEDVAENISKYNLLAMPIVDDNGRMLGIVTVDDALDVLEEEHEEDLAIAGARQSDSDDSSSGHLLSRVFSNEVWFFFWMVGACVLAFVSSANGRSVLPGLGVAALMPVCLHVAGTMSRYVSNFMLEYDEDDEDAPSLLGFTLLGVGVAVLYALVILLVGAGIVNAIGAADAGGTVSEPVLALEQAALALADIGMKDSALVVVITFATAPIYLVYLRRRDRNGKDINGFSLKIAALLVATILYVVIGSVALASGLGA